MKTCTDPATNHHHRWSTVDKTLQNRPVSVSKEALISPTWSCRRRETKINQQHLVTFWCSYGGFNSPPPPLGAAPRCRLQQTRARCALEPGRHPHKKESSWFLRNACPGWGVGELQNTGRFLFLAFRPQSHSGNVLSFCVCVFVKEKEVKVVVGGSRGCVCS